MEYRQAEAMRTLRELQQDDIGGIYQGYPEYFDTLKECEKRLGRDPRITENMRAELVLDWREALVKANELLARREYRESAIYFERSVNANPGEWYTKRYIDEANRGKAKALKMIGRQEEGETSFRGAHKEED